MYNYLRVNRLMVRLFAEGLMHGSVRQGHISYKSKNFLSYKMRHILIVFLNCAKILFS